MSLFRELGRNKEATRVIDEYIVARNQELDIYDLSKSHFFGDRMDIEIVDKFNKQFFQNEKKETAKEVLLRISGQNGWNPKDETILANTSADEYYDLFTSEVGDHLPRIVKKCLEFGSFSNADDRQKTIANNARGALIRLGSESNLNKRRMKRYGVNLD